MGKLRLLILTISLAVTFTILSPINNPYAEVIGKIVGKKAPDFSIKDLSGRTVSLSSFEGRPILLNVWATWCPYCRKERPHLKSLYKEYKSKGLVIIAVSTDKSVEKVRRYLKKIPMDFIILMDQDSIVARSYGVYALPTSFLIDRKGIIKHKFMGFRRWTDRKSKKLIEELLEE